jgi:hypothetical protein
MLDEIVESVNQLWKSADSLKQLTFIDFGFTELIKWKVRVRVRVRFRVRVRVWLVTVKRVLAVMMLP